MQRYPIPKQQARTEIRVSNSRFIATIAPAATSQAAQEFIRSIRAEMPDATHHVYAFRVGYGSSIREGMSDDGEPSGTSGPPALAVLRGTDIGDVVLVITRYFGGTKLGTGGLVSAYTAAAKAAIAILETEEKVTRVEVAFNLPYPLLETAKRLLPTLEAETVNENFAADVELHIRLPEEHLAKFERALADMSGGKITPRRMDDTEA